LTNVKIIWKAHPTPGIFGDRPPCYHAPEASAEPPTRTSSRRPPRIPPAGRSANAASTSRGDPV